MGPGKISIHCMSQFLRSHISTVGVTATPDLRSVASLTSMMEEVAHELRQPLSVIESLAYYLEMTSTDDVAASHLRRIQAMVMQANCVLSNACRDC
jgi:signal transduction histidine kinase